MEQTTNFETQNLDQNLTPITPPKNIFKILFFILLALVLVIAIVLTTFLITKNKKLALIEKTEIKTSITPVQMTNNLNSLKQALTDWNLYREIENNDNFFYYTDDVQENKKMCNTWFCNVPSDQKLYSFAQKILNGSIKQLTIGIRSVYITPNYENYSNQEFNNLNINPFATGLGEIVPIFAYSDKLIWSDTMGCGGALPDTQIGKENCTRTEYLEKLIKTAFEE